MAVYGGAFKEQGTHDFIQLTRSQWEKLTSGV
jgi:hypothetical protein